MGNLNPECIMVETLGRQFPQVRCRPIDLESTARCGWPSLPRERPAEKDYFKKTQIVDLVCHADITTDVHELGKIVHLAVRDFPPGGETLKKIIKLTKKT